jgi:Tfp pilus assembly protein PilF
MERCDSIFAVIQQNQFRRNRPLSVSANEKIDNGKYEEAINETTKAIHLNPKDVDSYFVRATLRIKVGDIEGARRDFRMCEICHRNKDLDLNDYPLV